MVTMLFKNTHYSCYVFLACSEREKRGADAMLTRALPLTSDARDVAAPPSVPHLAADLTLRASARHPNVHLLDAFMACIIRSSSCLSSYT